MYKFVCVLLFTSIHITYALRCYTCSVSETDEDQSCVTKPENVTAGNPITNCNKIYCTSMKVEYLDPIGKLQSMNRNCEDKPIYMNQIIEDGTYRITYKACQTDLCNGESGIVNEDPGEGTILAPGKKGSGSYIAPTITLIFSCSLLVNRYNVI